MRSKNLPMMGQAAGSLAAAILHAHAGRTPEAIAMGFFTAGFLAYVVEQKWKGLVEMAQAASRNIRKIGPPSMDPA
jgi:hypothetical protein